MRIDLDQHEPRSEPFCSQVCILGAGIAGLTLAHRLTQQGIDVALLEAGGAALTAASQSLIQQAVFPLRLHHGTQEGRFRAFGGASLRWGGQLLPLPAETTWPNVERYLRAAEQLLTVDDLPYDAAFFTALHTASPPEIPGLVSRLSKWAPFSHRNMANGVGRDLLAHPRSRVYLHAQVTELFLSANGERVAAASVRLPGGNTFRFEAAHFVVAAGTIETVRLLLASRSGRPKGLGNDYDQLGRNFHDHLTLEAATFTGPARTAVLRSFAPYVRGGTVHAFKLEASRRLCDELQINPAVAHITLEEPADTGLAILREILSARQRGDVAATLQHHAPHLPSAALTAVRALYAARIHHRRFIAADTAVHLQINIAQDTPSRSRITLADTKDAFGLPNTVVDWHISPRELASFQRFAEHLRAHLPAEGTQWQPELAALPLSLLDDARHGMGGACMGIDPQTSVVDLDLHLHGISNAHVASCAAFPDGSAQLPTLTLMALTLRLADYLIAQLS